MATKVFLTTTGNPTWPRDSTWNNANNKVEVVGAGHKGSPAAPGKIPFAGLGGGGGAYTFKDNVDLTASPTVPYQIGAGTTTAPTAEPDTWFLSATDVLAKAGTRPTSGVAPGGAAASCIPSANAFSGGGANGPGTGGRGGAGAAGETGAGSNTTDIPSGSAANGGTVPANTAGTNFQVSPAFGSGGGGHYPGNPGALYGGGGVAGAVNGGQGLIVLTWTPAAGKVWTQVHIYKGIENADTE